MTHLHISIATSGLMKERLAQDSKSQPWIVRACAMLCADTGAVIEQFACSIRAEGRRIETEATAIHGIGSSQADRGGIYELFVLGAICGLKAGPRRSADYPGMASSARYVIAWNVDYVRAVIASVFARHGEPADAWVRPGLSLIGLQPAATPWCRLPDEDGKDGGYRSPTRDEAAKVLLDLPARHRPVAPDSNIALERSLYAALRERGAFEAEAA